MISNETGRPIKTPRVLPRLFAKMLAMFEKHATNVELHLVNSAAMKVLNKRFRQKNKTTDVLSFSTRDPQLLGSIVVDVKTAEKQAKTYKHSFEREIEDLFIHGVLHLLGLDHQTKKEAEQMAQYEKYFASLLDRVEVAKKKRSH